MKQGVKGDEETTEEVDLDVTFVFSILNFTVHFEFSRLVDGRRDRVADGSTNHLYGSETMP